jgi:hypothetical protein
LDSGTGSGRTDSGTEAQYPESGTVSLSPAGLLGEMEPSAGSSAMHGKPHVR